MAPDLTRWNRFGLSRFRYTRGEAAEWLEMLRVHLLLVSALQNGGPLPAGLPDDPDAWLEALARGERLAGAAPDEAFDLAGGRWRLLEAPETEQGYRRAARAVTYRDAVAARYAHISPDQATQIARAFARAIHVLGRSIDAYAQEGLLGTVTQPEHLRLLVEMTGLTPTPAASATMPVALLLKDGIGAQTIAPGLTVEPRAKGKDAPLAFESLDPLLAHPALNTLRAADWLDATISDPIAGLSDVRLVRTVIELKGSLGDGLGVALQTPAGEGEAVAVQVLDRDGRTLRLRALDDLDLGAIAPRHLVLRPGLRLVPRRTGSGWLPLGPDHGLSAGMAVMANVGGRQVPYRVDRVEGADVRLMPESGSYADADRDATTEVTLAIRSSMLPKENEAKDDGSFIVPAHFSFNVARTQLATVVPVPGAVSVAVNSPVLATDRLTFDGDAVPSGLRKGNVALVERRPSGISVVRIAETGQEGDVYWARIEGADPADVRALRAGFEVTAEIAHETPSGASLLDGGRMVSGVAADALPGEFLGRQRTMLAVHEGGAVAFEATLEAHGDALAVVPVAPVPDGLAALTRGGAAVHGNVVTFGHGKSQPATSLGSGDATVEGQTFVYTAGTLSTRMAADEDGGVAPDVAITVDGRAYRRVASLADVEREDDAVYLTKSGFDGHVRFHFPFRLPTGRDNVMLTRIRVGAGAQGNQIAPNAVTKLAKADARIERVVQPLAPQFGRDLPTVEAVRTESRGGLRAVTHAVTAADFAAHAERNAGVWHARARAVVRPRGGGRVLMRVVVVPAGGGAITALREPLTAQLLKKAAPNVSVEVAPFVPVPLALDATVTLAAGYAVSLQLEAEIRSLILDQYGLRQRPLGNELFVSGIVAAVERHPAVRRVALSVTLVSADPAATPRRERWNADGTLQALVLTEDQSAFIDPERIALVFETGAG